MTRQSPASLRARSSNLSLRSAGPSMTNTQVDANRHMVGQSLWESSIREEGTGHSGAFIAAGMEGRPANQNTVCMDCYKQLTRQDRLLVTPALTGSCKLCAFYAVKPEAFTKPYCDFMTENPTIFHTVVYAKSKLEAAGYQELPGRDAWTGKLEAGGKYYTTRNGSSIIAFAVGKAYKPGNGVAMIAGHIDALTARLKPVSTKPNNNGYIQLGVTQYAGALNETWWDRDLGIGGRVIVRDEETGKTTVKLVKLGWPIARIPTLAPHFGIGMMGQNNRETQAVPIIGLDNSDLHQTSDTATPPTPLGGEGSFTSTQPPKLVKLIASELGIKDFSTILNWELELFDHAPATVGGMDKEFIFAGRIDDKLCSWAALQALLLAEHSDSDGIIKLVALFDDEEIGSLLRQGARGNFLPLTIERAVEALSSSSSSTSSSPSFGPGLLGQTYARSFLVSSDVTHAAHPNFPATNLAGHSPRLNVGVALCVDGSGHMTTDSVSVAILNRVADLAGTTNQTHMIRNDSRSGGTVGPMLSSAMGVRAADVGIPQLSMHSIRATTGALDPGLGVKFYKGFLDRFEEVDGEWAH
ncbi:Peptidase M18, aminopeptidase I [Coniochaeta hoffmannii]|uniref:Peptidase M18, aminopeptidase I n=1 Tax=Coniochaeta hoffmannii TaxID=91930 RepID=A0AA38VU78_9PEZI|nr:Peptidase M18, aminopeptidase I [Coniochaeta hoffmannii]